MPLRYAFSVNGTLYSFAASAASVGYVGLLFYLSFIQADELGELYRRTGLKGDDLLHILAFAVLGFLMFAAFSSSLYRGFIIAPRAWSIFVSLALAVIIELVQTNMPTRHASVIDLALHALGILIFLLGSLFIAKGGGRPHR
jgi:VanZ family protein